MSDTFAVEFPARLRALLETEAKDHGFPTVALYLEAMVMSNTPIDDRDDPELEVAILEGINSGAVVADEAFWIDLRRRCDEVVAQRRQA